jgi:mono/diheme cytochrome c family protein
VAAASSLVVFLSPPVHAAPHGARDGVYTAAQAARGLVVYKAHCVTCHAEGMTGGQGAPPLTGKVFMVGWQDETVGALYDYLRTMMPTGQAGSLKPQEYADALAAILQANGFPPSTDGQELPPDSAKLAGAAIGAAK